MPIKRKIYTGKRGGKYIIKNGKKYYISKKRKTKFGMLNNYNFTYNSMKNLEIIYKYMMNISAIFYNIGYGLNNYNKELYKRHSVYYSALRIGESAKKLNEQLKKDNSDHDIYDIIPGIPWKKIIRIRDCLGHTYNDNEGNCSPKNTKLLIHEKYKNINSYLRNISNLLGKMYPISGNNTSKNFNQWYLKTDI